MATQEEKERNKIIKVIRVINRLLEECVDTSKTRIDSRSINITTITKGLERLKKLYPYGYCDERVVDFVVYQIYRYRGMIEGKNGWSLTWCFSDNAVEKFRQQFIAETGKSGMNYYIDKWLNDGNLSREDLVMMLKDLSEHPLSNMIYIESEDQIKSRFINTEAGYFICQQATTGWTPMSSECSQCSNVVRCKETTEKKYPELFRLRTQWKIKS